MATVNVSDAQIEAARQAGQEALIKESHAASAWYESEKDLVWIKTTSGVYHGVPSQLLQGLEGATPEQLADIEVSPQGVALHWPQLDAGLTVQGIMAGRYGSKVWMAKIEEDRSRRMMRAATPVTAANSL